MLEERGFNFSIDDFQPKQQEILRLHRASEIYKDCISFGYTEYESIPILFKENFDIREEMEVFSECFWNSIERPDINCTQNPLHELIKSSIGKISYEHRQKFLAKNISCWWIF